MDVLTDVLRHLQVTGRVAGEIELGAPWSTFFPDKDHATVHIVSRGSCFLRLDGETTHLGPGDLVFLAHGTAHVLSDHPTEDAADSSALLSEAPDDADAELTGCRQIEGGGDGRRTTIICANFYFASGGSHPLRAILPPLVLLRSEDMVDAGWLEDSLRFIAREAKSSEPGSQLALDRLLDLLLVQTVRAWIRTEPAVGTGWLGALADPHVGQALRRLHQEPGRHWSVGDLAREVGMSRSGLAARFSNLVGEPPLRYLAGWRMRLAAQRLVQSDDSVGKVARSLGYQSEAAFGSVFKRHYGAPPGTWRRTVQALPDQGGSLAAPPTAPTHAPQPNGDRPAGLRSTG